MNQFLRHSRTHIPSLLAPPVEDEANLKAVKSDNAAVQNSIWDKRVLATRKGIKNNSDLANKLNNIRGLLIRRWRKNVWNFFSSIWSLNMGKNGKGTFYTRMKLPS